jgi:hypothetical protein
MDFMGRILLFIWIFLFGKTGQGNSLVAPAPFDCACYARNEETHPFKRGRLRQFVAKPGSSHLKRCRLPEGHVTVQRYDSFAEGRPAC